MHGDDLMPRAADLGFTGALTANAYLGAFGIAAALRAGADIVVTGRVTDASVVVGPAAAHFGWERTAYDELAGAMVAGHVIECGTHATGGNFSGFRAFAPDPTPLGFPIAEIAADGSSVITKHHGTGGVVTTDTVTAQLVYEVQAQAYLGPDVTARLDTVELTPDGEDRVRVSGVRGEAPPERLKVCVNELGGFRNTVEFVLVGLDIDAKADWVRMQMDAALAAHPPASVAWTLARTDREDAATEEAASCRLRCSVADRTPTWSAGRSPPPRSSSAWRRTRASPSPPRRPPPPRTASTGPPSSPAPRSPTPSSTPTAPPSNPRRGDEWWGRGRRPAPRGGRAERRGRPDRGRAWQPSGARPDGRAGPSAARPHRTAREPAPRAGRARRCHGSGEGRRERPAGHRHPASPSAPSSTPAAATRAATRTSGCGSTGARRPRSAPPG